MYVDITKKSVVNCVEWFHGYGGNALGLKRVIPGLRSVAVCERDAFVVANMVSKMEKGLLDAIPIWTDCKDFPVEPFRDRVDLFIASYPCQGFSHAGKRLGASDERHLWPSCRNFIRGAKPRFVWLENVEGHVSLGLSTVLADLEEDGYTAAWGIFSASEVGAPHQRKRVFVLAYDKTAEPLRSWDSRTGGSGPSDGSEDVAYQLGPRLQGHAGDGTGRDGQKREIQEQDRPVSPDGICGRAWPSRPGANQYGWEPPRVVDDTNGKIESQVGGNADGPADGLDFPGCTGLSNTELEEIYGWMVKGTNRTDELQMCGNGVVPQTAERAFRVLYAELLGSSGTDNIILQEDF